MSTGLDSPDAAELRHELARQLALAGALDSREWREAFEEVPRHHFAPTFTRRRADGGYEELTDTTDRVAWLRAVYADDSLVTHRTQDGTATSSSSQPSVMATMLAALDIRDGQSVLEIGTGTGYNAALLCHRLGDHLVSSVDIDPHLVQAAHQRLATLGYRPALTTGDGLTGWRDRAPFDRIIATCGTRRLPTTWLAQTKPGGVIVTNIGRGLIALHVNADGAASGMFTALTAAFMVARAQDTSELSLSDAADLATMLAAEPEARTRPTSVFADVHHPDFAVLHTLFVPGLIRLWTNTTYSVVDSVTRSAAHAQATGPVSGNAVTMTQSGPRELWTEIETAHHHWKTAGRPTHTRYGLTVTPNGEHTLWVDQPGSYPIRLRSVSRTAAHGVPHDNAILDVTSASEG